MLPNRLGIKKEILVWWPSWQNKELRDVLDTELLYLCWLVENTLTRSKECDYFVSVSMRSSWQQRVAALAEVKGIEL